VVLPPSDPDWYAAVIVLKRPSDDALQGSRVERQRVLREAMIDAHRQLVACLDKCGMRSSVRLSQPTVFNVVTAEGTREALLCLKMCPIVAELHLGEDEIPVDLMGREVS
jgi:hypothetical protein